MEKEKIVATFSVKTKLNKAATKKEGRPIYTEMEVCTMRTPGDQGRVTVQPAHHISRWEAGEPVTFAMRFNDQYLRFKAGRTQIQEGTPLSELPFLTESKRMELRACGVHTAETLAGIEGQLLKNLGMGARDLKNQAKAYLDAAKGTADITGMASTIEDLKRQIEEMKALQVAIPATVDDDSSPASAYATFSDEDLKSYIAGATGRRPAGNPSHETLVRMCEELDASREAA